MPTNIIIFPLVHLFNFFKVLKIVRIEGGIMKIFIYRFVQITLFALLFTFTFTFTNSVKASQSEQVFSFNSLIKVSPCSLFPINFSTTSGLASVTSNLTIKSGGRAEFYTGTVPNNGSYYTTISMKLQQYKSGTWKTIKTGTASGTGSQLYSSHYYVYKGYKYRGKSDIKVYKSKGGSLLTQKSITTSTRTY